MTIYFYDLLINNGANDLIANLFSNIISIIIIFLISLIFKIITDKIVLKVISKKIRYSKHKWDDFLLRRHVFKRLSHIVPALIIYLFAPVFPEYEITIKAILNIYFVLIILFTIDAFLTSINDIYSTLPISKNKPIKGFVQVIKIAVFTIGGIILLANIMGESPSIILGGIGAFMAVITLIFKDAILGFVAGVQITANDMIRIGDWIEMPKYDANGDVIDISLNTIKIKNFDNTITSVPAYAFISDSFKNWRGIQDTGARRIKRSIQIDVNSIEILSPNMIKKLKKITYISDYIENRQAEIDQYNKDNSIDLSEIVNGRHLTNIGVFKKYIENYLKNNKNICKDMIMMVRQISTTGEGLTLEIYAFTDIMDWKLYENLQSDIFDHIVAIVPRFNLKLFQNPSGNDIKQLLIK